MMVQKKPGSIVNIASAIAEKVQVNSPAYMSGANLDADGGYSQK